MNSLVCFPKVGTVAALSVLLWVGAGCGSAPLPRDLMMEEAAAGPIERPVAMKGETTFLTGKLAAVATVSRGFDRPGGRGGRRGTQDDGRRSRRDENPFTEVYNLYGDSEEEQKEAMEDYIRQAKARRAAGSPMPPVTLRVHLENKGTEPLEVEVTEVNSDLGNFAPRPAKITVPPGGQASLDPMISQLGVTSDEIPLKLAVRVAGQKEAQVVPVKSIISDTVKKEFEKMRK